MENKLPPALSFLLVELAIVDTGGVEVWALVDEVDFVFWGEGF
jgi:hypothetical protein